MSRRRVRLPVLPPVGPCRLSRWVVRVGAELAEDELYAELEADKAIMELRAPVACRLQKRCVEEGDAVSEGAVVALLEVDAPDTWTTDLVPTLHYRWLGRGRSR